MSKSKFNAAKKRLGFGNKTSPESEPQDAQATQRAQALTQTRSPEQQAAADFMRGVERSEETFTYTCITEDFQGKPIVFRKLKPGDALVLEESALSIKLTELGYNTIGLRDDAFDDAVASVPKLDGIEIAVNAARAVVVLAAVKPLFSHLPSDRCPDDRISVEDLPIEEVLAASAAIKKESGVVDAEARFRPTDGEGALGADSSEPERPTDDSDTESETARTE